MLFLFLEESPGDKRNVYHHTCGLGALREARATFSYLRGFVLFFFSLRSGSLAWTGLILFGLLKEDVRFALELTWDNRGSVTLRI